MNINKIQIKGFKSICDQTISLSPINILIGGNGIGKTNFISSFELLRNIYDRQLQRYVIEQRGASSILHLGRKTTSRISIDVEMENSGNKNRYAVELFENNDTLFISDSSTAYYYGSKWHFQRRDANAPEASISTDRTGQAYYVGPLLNQLRVYHFHDTSSNSPIKKNQSVNDNRFLHADGSNIASYLYYIKMKFPSYFSMIERTVASVIPFFKQFYLEPNRINPEVIRLEWLHDFGNEHIFQDSQLSDGSLRFICLVTLLLQPEPPAVIIIDEPELGLHPQAINKLCAIIQLASKKSQIIVSTQSVGLVDNFTPEDVIVVEKKDSASEYKRLNTQDLSQWLEEYSLGEIWEMNIIGGQPL